MAKTDTLSIYISAETKDKLMETYAEVIDQVQKGAVSEQLKNTNLSGDPAGGSVEARRMATSASQAYGTARAAGAGDTLKNNGVTINLSTDKEIVEEVENKDVKRYGIDGIVAKRAANHKLAMIVELDTAFFTEAVSAGADQGDLEGDTIVDKVEALIQSVEIVTNENVNGVPREMLALSLTPAAYGALRTKIDTLPNPTEGGVNVNMFHGVRVFSNHRQTEEAICMAVGAVAQPVTVIPYDAERIPLSNSTAIELFYSYGTKAVMPDLIKYGSVIEAEVSA